MALKLKPNYPYCVDCRHHEIRVDDNGFTRHWCLVRAITAPDPVTGLDKTDGARICRLERTDESHPLRGVKMCGPDGTLFERRPPKPTLLENFGVFFDKLFS